MADQRIFHMEAGVMALLEEFERELLALVQRDEYQPMPHVVITGLLELAGTMMKNGVRLEPSDLPSLMRQLAMLVDYVDKQATRRGARGIAAVPAAPRP